MLDEKNPFRIHSSSFHPYPLQIRSLIHGTLYGCTVAANARVSSHLGSSDIGSAHASSVVAMGMAYAGCVLLGSIVFALKDHVGVCVCAHACGVGWGVCIISELVFSHTLHDDALEMSSLRARPHKADPISL